METKQEKEIKHFKDITKKQIQEWKEAHPNAELIVVELEEDNLLPDAPVAQFVAIPPTRNVLNAVTKYSQEKEAFKANKVLMKNCILGGDMYLLENEDDNGVYLAVLEQLGELLDKKKATRKKL